MLARRRMILSLPKNYFERSEKSGTVYIVRVVIPNEVRKLPELAEEDPR